MKFDVFDFDGTIYDGDSSIDFFLYNMKKNKKMMIKVPKIMIMLVLNKLKLVNKVRFKETFFEFLKNTNNVDEILTDFWTENDKKIKMFFRERKNTNDIIISASPKFLIESGLKNYKCKYIIASEVDKNYGKFLSNNCKGEEKVKRLHEIIPNAIVDNMYTDSLSDLPLINISNNSYIVIKDSVIKYNDMISKKYLLSRKIRNNLINCFRKR